MVKKDELTFAFFFAVWATKNNWEVPDFHWEIVQFLDSSESWENNTAVLQVFRGAGKSTIIDLFIVYMLCKDPTLRFLVLSADHKTASRMTEDCLSIIKRHPLARKLKGKEQTWQKHRFFVRGSTDARNPSVSAHGIMSNITSARADFIILDDVEVMKNVHSDDRRETLRKRISETTHILIPQTGRTLYVGTPHAFESIYTERVAKGASTLTLPLLSNAEGEFPYIKGVSRWPKRFDDATVASRQLEAKSKGEFISQYQLIPHQLDHSIFDPSRIKFYKEEIEFYQANGHAIAKLGEIQLASVTSFWDVALSKARGDDSVLSFVFTATNGNIYLHRSFSLDGDVDQQCEKVVEYALQFNIPIIKVETNGIGAFVPQVLMKYARPHGLAVDAVYTSKNKVQKIIEAFETPLSGGFFYAHESVASTKFVSQLQDFNPRFPKGHDDFIDSAASAISEEPIRIGASNFGQNKNLINWMSQSGGFEAKVDYATA